MSTTDAETISPSTSSTGGDADLEASTGAEECDCAPGDAALVVSLDDLAALGTEPAAVGPAVAVLVAWLVLKRRRKAKQGAR